MRARRVSSRRAGGFALVEIILGIGVLALVGLVVVQMFIMAANTQNRARDLDMAAALAQTAAETCRATGALEARSHYDRDWNPLPHADPAGYTVEAERRGSPSFLYIAVYKNQPYPGRNGERVLLFDMRAAACEGGDTP